MRKIILGIVALIVSVLLIINWGPQIKAETELNSSHFILETTRPSFYEFEVNSGVYKQSNSNQTVEVSGLKDAGDALNMQKYSEDLDAVIHYSYSGCQVSIFKQQGTVKSIDFCQPPGAEQFAGVINVLPKANSRFIVALLNGGMTDDGYASIIRIVDHNGDFVTDITNKDMISNFIVDESNIYYLLAQGENLEDLGVSKEIAKYEFDSREESTYYQIPEHIVGLDIFEHNNKLFLGYSNMNRSTGSSLIPIIGTIVDNQIVEVSFGIYIDPLQVQNIGEETYFLGVGAEANVYHLGSDNKVTRVGPGDTVSTVFSKSGYYTYGRNSEDKVILTTFDYSGQETNKIVLQNQPKGEKYYQFILF